MTEEQIIFELSEIDKDEYLTEEQKNNSRAIYNAELQRIRYDKMINYDKDTIEKLKIKIINRIKKIYPNLDEEKKEKVQTILYDITTSEIFNTSSIIKTDYIETRGEIASESLSGSIDIYIDDELHKDLEKIYSKSQEYLNYIDRKYLKIDEELNGIIDSEIFNFYTSEENIDYKEQQDFDQIFVKENKRINEMDIYPKEKGILRNIIIDATKYGKSYGQIYLFKSNIDDYNQIMNELDGLSNKTI